MGVLIKLINNCYDNKLIFTLLICSLNIVKSQCLRFPCGSDSFSSSEKEKVEGEELQQWLNLVVAPTELSVFIRGKQESLLPLQAEPGITTIS